eukprot:SAG11_NODE_1561_length_4677_cov_2.447138_3_plen_65_part_00
MIIPEYTMQVPAVIIIDYTELHHPRNSRRPGSRLGTAAVGNWETQKMKIFTGALTIMLVSAILW